MNTDLEAVKAMLVNAINAAMHPDFPTLTSELDLVTRANLDECKHWRLGDSEAVMRCADNYYDTEFDLNKLAAAVLDFFAAREAALQAEIDEQKAARAYWNTEWLKLAADRGDE